MPEVRKGEKRIDYMKRCILYVIKNEGASAGNAWHKCDALFKKAQEKK